VPCPPGTGRASDPAPRVAGNPGQGAELGRQVTAQRPRLRRPLARAHADGDTPPGVSVNHRGGTVVALLDRRRTWSVPPDTATESGRTPIARDVPSHAAGRHSGIPFARSCRVWSVERAGRMLDDDNDSGAPACPCGRWAVAGRPAPPGSRRPSPAAAARRAATPSPTCACTWPGARSMA